MIAVIGDLIIDKFIYGTVNRISPESPNMILDFEDEKENIGGSYNVVKHLRSLGCAVQFFSMSGEKGFEKQSMQLNDKNDNVLWDSNRHVISKTRYVSKFKRTSLLRVDRENKACFSEKQQDLVLNEIFKCEPSVIVISDYNKGVVTKFFMDNLNLWAQQRGIPVLVDTKRSDISVYEGAYLLKPNNFEYAFIKAQLGKREMSDGEAAQKIFQKYKIRQVVLTKGENGVQRFFEGLLVDSVPAKNVAPIELSGAGDSVLAVLAYGVEHGLEMSEAVEMANCAAAKFIVSGPSYNLRKEDLSK